MPAYHQMGFNSMALVREERLQNYMGLIVSPVNCPDDECGKIMEYCFDSLHEVIFDPQMYNPSSPQRNMRAWSYFPDDFESADKTNLAYWSSVVDGVIKCCVDHDCDGVCSPAFLPRKYTSGYYALITDIFEEMQKSLPGGKDLYLTLVLHFDDLVVDDVGDIADLVTGRDVENVYLVLSSEVPPKEHLTNEDALVAVMKLINILSNNGIKVLVSNCSLDIVLWKVAGAHSGATGQHGNLRRFSSSRWDAPVSGPRIQKPYIIEEAFLANVSDADFVRLDVDDLASAATLSNEFYVDLKEAIRDKGHVLALSWRFYLYWFMDFISRCEADADEAEEAVLLARRNWRDHGEDLILDDPKNDGVWVSRWLRAIRTFKKL